MPSKYDRCCLITNVFGYSLKEGIVIVAVASIIISTGVLFASLIFFCSEWSKESSYNTDPVKAIYFISAMVAVTTSLYEIVISLSMLWFMRLKKDVALLSLYFVSNVVLLTFFNLLAVVRIALCIKTEEYTQAFFNALFGIIYEAVFIYFCIVVNSYESSLDPDTLIY